MAWTETDLAHMRAALAQAKQADAQDEVPVGAVVTIDGEASASGDNRSIVVADPIGHAEIVALRGACGAAEQRRPAGPDRSPRAAI